jgi:hypothetical protein
MWQRGSDPSPTEDVSGEPVLQQTILEKAYGETKVRGECRWAQRVYELVTVVCPSWVLWRRDKGSRIKRRGALIGWRELY